MGDEKVIVGNDDDPVVSRSTLAGDGESEIIVVLTAAIGFGYGRTSARRSLLERERMAIQIGTMPT